MFAGWVRMREPVLRKLCINTAWCTVSAWTYMAYTSNSYNPTIVCIYIFDSSVEHKMECHNTS